MSRVALAHDYLTQQGGAERVALALLRAFDGGPLYTSVYAQERTFPGFRQHDVRTSPLQRVPLFRRDPRMALPVLAQTWSRTTAGDCDAVITSSSGWAHGIRTAPGVRKIVYCHNPARWLYQTNDYLGHDRGGRAALGALRPWLRRWDAAAAHSADRYLVNSTVVAARVKRVYGIDAEVLPPPVSVDPQGEQDPLAGLAPGFLLTVARGRGYKNTSIVEEAVSGLAGQRLVVVGGTAPAGGATHSSARHVGVVTDAQLRWLYANARALVSVSNEDFGLTPIEANAFGTPAVVLRAGGFLDTLAEGVSGVYVEAPTPAAVREALRELPDLDPLLVRRHAQRYAPAAFSRRLHAVVSETVGRRVIDLTAQARSIDLRAHHAPTARGNGTPAE
jgi:glycosyltransferase involved in cell wall biosynthesis